VRLSQDDLALLTKECNGVAVYQDRSLVNSLPARTDFARLPVVDVGPLLSDHLADRRVASQALDSAAREAGFCYLVGHPLARDLLENLISQAKAFFSLPMDEKMRWYIGNSRHHRGYVPEGEEVFSGGTHDKKEAFDVGYDLPADDPDVLAGTPTMGPNVWPDLPGFRTDVDRYYNAALRLGTVVFHGFALALGLDEHFFDAFVTKPPSQLRLIHYPYNPDAQDAVGIGAHTDYECFTILLSTAPGLEVMNGAGKWIDAPPVDGALILNIGDLIENWTNGEYRATPHRVRRVSEERYSFPLFCTCDYHTVVEPLAQFVAPDRPARYQRLVAGAHLFHQLGESFHYLKSRVERGELVLPDGSPDFFSEKGSAWKGANQ
jgi:isopenicillin N synthase-like dioxygenase